MVPSYEEAKRCGSGMFEGDRNVRSKNNKKSLNPWLISKNIMRQ